MKKTRYCLKRNKLSAFLKFKLSLTSKLTLLGKNNCLRILQMSQYFKIKLIQITLIISVISRVNKVNQSIHHISACIININNSLVLKYKLSNPKLLLLKNLSITQIKIRNSLENLKWQIPFV